jgi:hypothetical protein
LISASEICGEGGWSAGLKPAAVGPDPLAFDFDDPLILGGRTRLLVRCFVIGSLRREA